MDEDDEFFPDQISDDPHGRQKSRRGRNVAVLAAGLVAGGTLAGAVGAVAANGPSASPASSAASSEGTSTPAAGGRMGDADHSGNPGGAAAVRSDEKELSGAAATKAKAAALKAVPGGTIIRVETDAGDGVYEAHMKKADGTLVTVKLDKNFVVTKVEAGMGLGDPRPAGGGRGPGNGGPGEGGPGGGHPGGEAPGGAPAA